MKKQTTIHILLIAIVLCTLLSCGFAKQVPASNRITTTNSKETLSKPYVILISLDGFRWDYVDRYNPPYLSSFIKEGTKAASLIPSFPTKTFPNHYTIATGMYPDNHGLLANSYYNYDKEAMYSIRNRETVTDGSFYNGTPIWVQANNAGMVTASYFFVGTEADIQGVCPTYYYDYDGAVSNEARVAQAVKWLALQEEKRPHLITLYFSDMDDTGHRYGPNNEEKIKETLFKLDATLGDLFQKVEKTGLPVNIVIVSDHGMLELNTDQLISTESLQNESLYNIVDNGVLLNVHPKDFSKTEEIYQVLKNKEAKFKVYKTVDTPHFEYKPKNKNWGPIQILPEEGYYFSSSSSIERRKKSGQEIFGVHGFTPEMKEMHGILYANGPSIKNNFTHPSIKNIHIYPLLCRLLEIDIPNEIDGKLEEIKDVLREN